APRAAVDGENELVVPFRIGGGEENPVAPNHRGGPGPPVNRGLPSDILILGPLDRQPDDLGRGVPIQCRTAEIWPVSPRKGGEEMAEEDKDGDRAGHRLIL